ncbi:hypothetical protein ACMXYX_18070 (plasmid) [Neptuniibacter sp. QD72_48]|uniref:hypothetical protein n=1 Tax=Neptuniibacter sp. QD72_48 TaxID=3398214 RepID=UPI0039F62C8C
MNILISVFGFIFFPIVAALSSSTFRILGGIAATGALAFTAPMLAVGAAGIYGAVKAYNYFLD